MCEQVITDEAKLNHDQKKAYDEIVKSIESTQIGPKVFFIDGPGGTGKTFLYNLILAYVRSLNEIALQVASSGIAALLLNGGTTAHSRFKIPLSVHQDSVCNISLNTPSAELLRIAKVIIWDEAPMAHKHCFEAVDRLLRDIMKKVDKKLGSIPFGGKVVIFGGDFRQILPVVRHGNRPKIVAAALMFIVFYKN